MAAVVAVEEVPARVAAAAARDRPAAGLVPVPGVVHRARVAGPSRAVAQSPATGRPAPSQSRWPRTRAPAHDLVQCK